MKNKLIVISAMWCPSCLILKKNLKKIQEEYEIEYQLLDYDFDDEVNELNVGETLPVIIYNDKRLIGEKNIEELIEFLKGCDLI